jgi:hypothetical protein
MSICYTSSVAEFTPPLKTFGIIEFNSVVGYKHAIFVELVGLRRRILFAAIRAGDHKFAVNLRRHFED